MIKLIAKVQAFMLKKDGATAVEYGLLVGGISLAIMVSVFAFGTDLRNMFNSLGSSLASVSSSAQANASG